MDMGREWRVHYQDRQEFSHVPVIIASAQYLMQDDSVYCVNVHELSRHRPVTMH